MPDRQNIGVDVASSEALARAQAGQPQFLRAHGPALEVKFPAALTRRDVAHGLGVVPDGYLLARQVGGFVRAIDVHLWTADRAYLEADTAGTRAVVMFFTFREGVVDDRSA